MNTLSALFNTFVLIIVTQHGLLLSSADTSGESEYTDSPYVLKTKERGRPASDGICPKLTLKNGFVQIRSRGRVARFKCRPNYQMVGKRFSTCVRGRWNSPVPICISRGCIPLEPPLNGRLDETYRNSLIIFDCDPGFELKGSQILYCNGSRWNASTPVCEAAMRDPPLSCDFEQEDLCGWWQDPYHDFDWRRNNFATPSGHVGTGPSHDHTLGEGKDGYYMYIEASTPRKENDTARLFSPVYPAKASHDSCFIFWFHMYGSASGFLNVFVKPSSSRLQDAQALFHRSGDQGNRWLLGKVQLPVLDETFQIVVEGIRGINYISDTAIDDVQLANSTECQDTAEATSALPDVEVRNITGTCKERCGVFNPEAEECICISGCDLANTCCSDYERYCSPGMVSTEPQTTESIVEVTSSLTPEMTSAPSATVPESSPTVLESTETSSKLDSSVVSSVYSSSWALSEIASSAVTLSPTPLSSFPMTVDSTTTISSGPNLTSSSAVMSYPAMASSPQTEYPIPNLTIASPSSDSIPSTEIPPIMNTALSIPVVVTSSETTRTSPELSSSSVDSIYHSQYKSGIVTSVASIADSSVFVRTTSTVDGPLVSSIVTALTIISSTSSAEISSEAEGFDVGIQVETSSTVFPAMMSSTDLGRSTTEEEEVEEEEEEEEEDDDDISTTPSKPKKQYFNPTRRSKEPEIISKPHSSVSHKSGGLSSSVIAGVVIGGFLITLLVGVVSYKLYKRRNSRQDKLADDSDVRYLKDEEVQLEFSDPSKYDDTHM